MKAKTTTIWISVIFLGVESVVGQSVFQNLNFEDANPVSVGDSYVTAASAFPYWTAYIGTSAQSDVLQNAYTSGSVAVEIFGPNNPATISQPGSLDGHYSAFLEGGLGPLSTTMFSSASIAQTGTVPVGSESVQFEVWDAMPANSAVSFDGVTLSPIILGTGSDYTLYGASISAWAGQTGQLEFTSTIPSAGLTLFGIDDVSFSNVAVAPEPDIAMLSVMGGLLFGARKWLARR